jgi:hypothetical protein
MSVCLQSCVVQRSVRTGGEDMLLEPMQALIDKDPRGNGPACQVCEEDCALARKSPLAVFGPLLLSACRCQPT